MLKGIRYDYLHQHITLTTQLYSYTLTNFINYTLA